MDIRGTNRSDNLSGTSGDDFIDGRRGSDWLEGGAGVDQLNGGAGADKFVVRAGDGIDIALDFDPYHGDRAMFDIGGSWSDIMYLGRLSDGQVITTVTGTEFLVEGGDFNSDGVTDTRITSGADGIVLLGWAPGDLLGWMLQGG